MDREAGRGSGRVEERSEVDGKWMGKWSEMDEMVSKFFFFSFFSCGGTEDN